MHFFLHRLRHFRNLGLLKLSLRVSSIELPVMSEPIGEGRACFGLSRGGSPLAEIEGIRAARGVTLADRQGARGGL
jgi:hypothetical protein